MNAVLWTRCGATKPLEIVGRDGDLPAVVYVGLHPIGASPLQALQVRGEPDTTCDEWRKFESYGQNIEGVRIYREVPDGA